MTKRIYIRKSKKKRIRIPIGKAEKKWANAHMDIYINPNTGEKLKKKYKI